MKKLLFSAFALSALAACNTTETTENGVEYRILAHEADSRAAELKDMLLVNLRLATESSDSVLMETFSDNTPRYIPVDEPTLKEVFLMAAKGDSIEMFVNADTLFQKSFGSPTPAGIQPGERIHFLVKIVDIFSQQELEKKSMEQMQTFRDQDSVTLSNYLKEQTGVKTTPSGLMYIVVEEGKGVQAKKGDKVSMLYKGYFMNGETFDENQNRDKPFEFAVGLGQVISGWDEGVQLMKQGGKYKLIVPWQLAYGERGTGPILPFTSLIFDVELLKVN